MLRSLGPPSERPRNFVVLPDDDDDVVKGARGGEGEKEGVEERREGSCRYNHPRFGPHSRLTTCSVCTSACVGRTPHLSRAPGRPAPPGLPGSETNLKKLLCMVSVHDPGK